MRLKLIPLIVVALFLIVSAPAIRTRRHSTSPYVAQAGHTLPGAWCQCGCPGCICELGEDVGLCILDSRGVSLPAAAGEASHKTPMGAPELLGFFGILIVGIRIWLLSR